MLRTSQEYRERLFQMRPNIYIGGEKVSRDDHRLIPGINVLEVTYDLAHNPKWKGIMTVHSPLIGEEINRFATYHNHPQSPYDLMMKQTMIRLAPQPGVVGGCHPSLAWVPMP